MQQLTQQHCQLDAAPGEGTLMSILTAAVLQHKLGWQEQRMGWSRREFLGGPGLNREVACRWPPARSLTRLYALGACLEK